jgi:endonuclease-3
MNRNTRARKGQSPSLAPAARRSGRESLAARAARAATIADRLAVAHPGASCSLDFDSPYQLVIATILSAQCTDKRVNIVTVSLFDRWPTAEALAAATQPQVEAVIRPTGFFRAKAKNIRGCCAALVARHGGQVPLTLDELIHLPGVGRKTANVVLNMAFGQITHAVDTHVFRIANRLRIAPGRNPLQVELGLEKAVPEEFGHHAHHWLILHGRYACKAVKPLCAACIVADLCDSADKRTG